MEAQGLTPYRLERRIGLSARVVRRALAGADVRASHWLQLAWALGLLGDLKKALPPRPDLAVTPQLTTEERIVEFLRLYREDYHGTVRDLAENVDRSVSQTYRSLHRLQERGRIRWEKLYGNVYTFRLLSYETNPRGEVEDEGTALDRSAKDG